MCYGTVYRHTKLYERRLCVGSIRECQSFIASVCKHNEVTAIDSLSIHLYNPIQPHQQESVRGLTTCVFDDYPVVLTGGTDRIVRMWNLRDAGHCCCVVKPKYLKRVQFDYQYVVLVCANHLHVIRTLMLVIPFT